MNLTADQLGDLKRRGFYVIRVRNGWRQALNRRTGWAGEKRHDVERAWQDAGAEAGLCAPPAGLCAPPAGLCAPPAGLNPKTP